MSNRKIVVPKYRFEHDTTAERLAYAYGVDDIGNVAIDMENGHTYLITGSGAGASSLKNLTAQGQIVIPIPLTSLREVSSGSDVGNVAAIGGVLASDTTPILRGDAAESWEVAWATGNVDEVGCMVPLPLDASGNALLDGSRDVTLILEVYSGTSDAATFAVGSVWDGGTQVADSASDASTKSATRHRITATIAAADVPDSPKVLSLELTPGTHGSDVTVLTGLWVCGYRK